MQPTQHLPQLTASQQRVAEDLSASDSDDADGDAAADARRLAAARTAAASLASSLHPQALMVGSRVQHIKTSSFGTVTAAVAAKYLVAWEGKVGQRQRPTDANNLRIVVDTASSQWRQLVGGNTHVPVFVASGTHAGKCGVALLQTGARWRVELAEGQIDSLPQAALYQRADGSEGPSESAALEVCCFTCRC